MTLCLLVSGVALIIVIASGGAILKPGLWAGATFILTWLLIGLLALGALIGRATPREAWLGATFFGAGFMILALARAIYQPWAGPPTVDLLNEIRPWLPAFANGRRADANSTTAANARIHEALECRVPMHFVEETPLEDVLNAIKNATRSADGKNLPIYVDPIGLMKPRRP